MLEFSKPIQILDVKSINDDWKVEGYASTFENPDDGDDIVAKKAFTRTLTVRPKPVLLQSHDIRMALGRPALLQQDGKGLYGEFKISKTALGSDARQLVMDGVLDSFSIGYRAADYEYVQDGKYRLLKDIDLYEVSLVAIPMNREAVVTGWKDYLAQLGIKEDLSLADKAHVYAEGISQLLNDIRGLTEGDDRPLSDKKRLELTELLGMFPGLDAVRSELQRVLTPPQSKLVEPKLISYQLAEARKRLSTILQE